MGWILRGLREDLVAQVPVYGSPWFRRWKFLYNIAACSGVHGKYWFCHLHSSCPDAPSQDARMTLNELLASSKAWRA
jgi:hypothetical protein